MINLEFWILERRKTGLNLLLDTGIRDGLKRSAKETPAKWTQGPRKVGVAVEELQKWGPRGEKRMLSLKKKKKMDCR